MGDFSRIMATQLVSIRRKTHSKRRKYAVPVLEPSSRTSSFGPRTLAINTTRSLGIRRSFDTSDSMGQSGKGRFFSRENKASNYLDSVHPGRPSWSLLADSFRPAAGLHS